MNIYSLEYFEQTLPVEKIRPALSKAVRGRSTAVGV